MNESQWSTDFNDRVIEILRSNRFILDKPHEFGRPFVSVYQIASAFQDEYPEICAKYNKGMTVDYKFMKNLQIYFATQLARCVKSDPDGYPVEAVWLSANGLDKLHYERDGKTVVGEPNPGYKAFSLYRIKE